MKKINKVLSLILFPFLFVGIVSCSKKSSDSYYPAEHENIGDKTDANNNVVINTNRKIYYTVNYSIYSDDLSKIKSDIATKTISLEGHISSSDENNYRSYITYRVPTNKLNEFLDYIDSFNGVSSKNISSSDITSEYSYTQARIETLEASKTAYLKLLEDETLTRAEIIQIQDKLDSINTELTSINNTLALYNDLVEYSTINISYYQNDRYSYEEPTFFEEYFSFLGDFVIGLFKGIMYSLPFIIVIGGIFSAIYFPIRHHHKKKNK